MTTTVVFETHSLSEDNEHGVASGWLSGQLSDRGRELAQELGERRRNDGLSAVFTSDLRRAAETALIAFAGTHLPLLYDWRLRECDFGELNGAPVAAVHDRRVRWLQEPYPGGESWTAAVARVAGFLRDVQSRWRGQRILVIGHVATCWSFEHYLNGVDLESLVGADFGWREGWEYDIDPSVRDRPAPSALTPRRTHA